MSPLPGFKVYQSEQDVFISASPETSSLALNTGGIGKSLTPIPALPLLFTVTASALSAPQTLAAAHNHAADYFRGKGALLLHLPGISYTNIFNHL